MIREFQASEFLSTIIISRRTIFTKTIRLKMSDLYSVAERFEAQNTEYAINLDDYSIDAFRRKYTSHVEVNSSEIRIKHLSGTFVHQLTLNQPSKKVTELFIKALNERN